MGQEMQGTEEFKHGIHNYKIAWTGGYGTPTSYVASVTRKIELGDEELVVSFELKSPVSNCYYTNREFRTKFTEWLKSEVKKTPLG